MDKDTNLEVLQRDIPHVQKAKQVQLALGAKTFNFACDIRDGEGFEKMGPLSGLGEEL
jgi:hypothetical protein